MCNAEKSLLKVTSAHHTAGPERQAAQAGEFNRYAF